MQISRNLTPRYLVWYALVMIAAGRGFADDPTPEVHELTYGEAAKVQMDASRLEDAESLATYVHPDHKTDGGAAIWAYRQDDTRGRIVNIGSHPEGSDAGEKLALTEACRSP